MTKQDYAQQFERLKQASRARREAHPDWPSHRSEVYWPGGHEITSEAMPIAKMPAYKGYCKYCYQTHRNWWLMDQDDYQVEGLTIILCGE